MFDYAKSIDHAPLFAKLTRDGATILARYRRNYGLGTDVTLDQVKAHAALEAELTNAILASAPHDRAAVSSAAYSRLYSDLTWLVGVGTESGGEDWLALIPRGSQVYEVGSGTGYLANFLNAHGVNCVRTDISSERNDSTQTEGAGGVQVTDGVRLSEFAEPGHYDFVISNQVVEHLHPDDIIAHFTEARKLLKPGGAYICCAPCATFGPQDLSSVFGEPKAVFMHLHEFHWHDVPVIERTCGYRGTRAVFRIPGLVKARRSLVYYWYLRAVEPIFAAVPFLRKLAKAALVPTQVWVVLQNPALQNPALQN